MQPRHFCSRAAVEAQRKAVGVIRGSNGIASDYKGDALEGSMFDWFEDIR